MGTVKIRSRARPKIPEDIRELMGDEWADAQEKQFAEWITPGEDGVKDITRFGYGHLKIEYDNGNAMVVSEWMFEVDDA